jgi:hypothetical protein
MKAKKGNITVDLWLITRDDKENMPDWVQDAFEKKQIVWDKVTPERLNRGANIPGYGAGYGLSGIGKFALAGQGYYLEKNGGSFEFISPRRFEKDYELL